MLVSPDLTNESLFAAQKFVRLGLGSNGIDSTARWALPGGPDCGPSSSRCPCRSRASPRPT